MSRAKVKPTTDSDPTKVVELVCSYCGATRLEYKSQIPGRIKRHFCSRACCNQALVKTAPTAADIDRFWSYIDRSGGPDACWPWLRGQTPSGHGRVRWPGRPNPRIASRVAYELTYGVLPPLLRHTCNNTLCCNPTHLVAGHRTPPLQITRRPGRVLTVEDVEVIRQRYATGSRGNGLHALAREYGVSHTTIRAVVLRKTWKPDA